MSINNARELIIAAAKVQQLAQSNINYVRRSERLLEQEEANTERLRHQAVRVDSLEREVAQLTIENRRVKGLLQAVRTENTRLRQVSTLQR